VLKTVRALFLFFLRPGEATRALEGGVVAWFAPLPVSAAFFGYLAIRGCPAGDAAVAGLGLLGIVVGAGVVGGFATYPASLVTGASYTVRRRIGPCLLFAAWTAVLFAVLVAILQLSGVGAPSALYATLILVIWAVAAGAGVVAGDQTEGGRALVGSCIGMAGALIGLWIALLAVQAQLLFVVPAPVKGPGFAPGDALLVRRQTVSAPPGTVVLMRRPGGPEALVAQVNAAGRPEALDSVNEPRLVLQQWDMVGRVFFHFGGSGGGSVVPVQQPD